MSEDAPSSESTEHLGQPCNLCSIAMIVFVFGGVFISSINLGKRFGLLGFLAGFPVGFVVALIAFYLCLIPLGIIAYVMEWQEERQKRRNPPPDSGNIPPDERTESGSNSP